LDYNNASSDTLVDALVNSCSIPFAFRTFADSTMIVDGGVCANLPAPQIKTGGEVDVLPVAFSFPNEAFLQRADNVIAYAKLLVSSAMQNSINEACKRVEIMGSKVVRLNSPLTTFDFERAMSYIDEEAYVLNIQQVHSEIVSWIHGINMNKRYQRHANTSETVRFLNMCLYEIFQSLYSPQSVQISKAAIIVTANCLFPRSDPRARVPDQVEHLIELRPKVDALRAFSVTTFGMSDGDPGREWSVTTEKLTPVKVICTPLVKPGQNEGTVTAIMAMFF
jgi:hypothetical protein